MSSLAPHSSQKLTLARLSKRHWGQSTRLSRVGIVLTLVRESNEGHRVYRAQSGSTPGKGTILGGQTDDPRGQSTRAEAASHPPGRGAGQRQPGLPRSGDLPRLVLSLAEA